jgi:fructose-bisphosphate aldolase class 1
LSPRYILGEIGRGQFIAILYRTNFEQATQLRNEIYDLWKNIHEISGTKVGVGVTQMDPTQGTAIQAYNKFIDEIKKARTSRTPLKMKQERRD